MTGIFYRSIKSPFVENKTSMNRPIKIALVGCGEWGKHYLRVFSSVPDVEMKAVVDPREERQAFAKSLVPDITTYANMDALLAGGQCDTAVIATPASTHYQAVKQALLGGLDVLVEKPMTTSVKEAEELCRIAKENGRILMVAHTFIYNSAVRALKEMVNIDRLGKVYYIRACRTHLGLIREDVNVVWDLAAHDTSIFIYLLGRFVVLSGFKHEQY
jgi:predicted dehydrogenase